MNSPLPMQFEDRTQKDQTGILGMWIFIATEVLFFGGLFLLYSIYRWFYNDTFVTASKELNLIAATTNTLLLLTSSLTVAVAEHVEAAGKKKIANTMVAITFTLGILFLGIKAYEYFSEYRHQLIPFLNQGFHWSHANEGPAKIFFNLYFVMTGLHALHLIIGCGILSVILCCGKFFKDKPAKLRVAALYWHFVDIVWVFLFPLLYLAR